MSHEWVVDKEKTKDFWLELHGKIPGGDTWRRAVVKWDGCIHFDSFANLPLEASPDRKDPNCADCYIHICDIDEMIEDLQKITDLAIEHFRDQGGSKSMGSWGNKP